VAEHAVIGWQVPSWQLRPEQQSEGDEHETPCILQLDPAAHAPFEHTLEQHWPLVVHAAPVWLHAIMAPHVPWLQTLEQQSLASVHVAPVAAHFAPQIPFWQVSVLQQPAPQLSPAALQEAQTSLAQVPLQHSENARHVCPPALHAVPVPVEAAPLAAEVELEVPAPCPPAPDELDGPLPPPPQPPASAKSKGRSMMIQASDFMNGSSAPG
jgi:hypothetical protein